jgi:hypothetical protein
MTHDSHELTAVMGRLDHLEKRCECLERQNRLLKFGWLTSLLAVGLIIGLGASLADDVVKAKKFVLEDDLGKVRGEIATDNEGPYISLRNKNDVQGVFISAYRGISRLELKQPEGGASKGQASLFILSNEHEQQDQFRGKAKLVLISSEGQRLVVSPE